MTLVTFQCPRCGWTTQQRAGADVWHNCQPPGRTARQTRCHPQPKDNAA